MGVFFFLSFLVLAAKKNDYFWFWFAFVSFDFGFVCFRFVSFRFIWFRSVSFPFISFPFFVPDNEQIALNPMMQPEPPTPPRNLEALLQKVGPYTMWHMSLACASSSILQRARNGRPGLSRNLNHTLIKQFVPKHVDAVLQG